MATILIVDDKPLNRSLLTTLLEYHGHRLVEAASGLEAIERTLAEHPQLIITDILMPHMDGYQLVRRLRETDATRNVKVVFYSALYREEKTRTLAAACGVSRLICKPTDPEEILRIVEDVLSSESPNTPPSPDPMANAEVVRLLSDKLYQKVLELETLNAKLESTISQRTKELEETNRSLREQIAERQKAEESAAADRENKLKIKSDFLSHVSHELRSPLAVVHQFVPILLDGLGGSINPNQKEYLEIAQRNINQLKGMIDDLLEASRAETCKLSVKCSVTQLSDVLQKTVLSFRATAVKKSISLQTNILENLPPAYADSARVGQVVTNLLDNAIKFSPAKSSITICAQVCEEDPTFLCVSVADCGCGIEPAESERIFDRLYQVKNSLEASRRGLGLGLFICKELISLHGGRIWNDPKRRGGSTLSFTLPVFSIASMIAPVVTKMTPTDNSFALVTVEIRPVKAWPSERKREQVAYTVLEIIRRCILPDLDVILPGQSRAGVDIFWIVARANQKGAGVISKRLRDQILDCQDLKVAGISCEVTFTILGPETVQCDWPLERRVQVVASSLEKLLPVETIERRVLVR